MKFYFVLVGLFLTIATHASEYPLDYAVKTSCDTQGAVRLCRGIQIAYSLAVLDIDYTGALKDYPGLKIWIRVNYNNGLKEILIPMSQISTGTEYGTIGRVRITGGCLVGELGGCAKQGTAEMRDLLQWAQRSDGRLNALDLDVAFVSGDGTWDNNGKPYGTYHFSFGEN